MIGISDISTERSGKAKTGMCLIESLGRSPMSLAISSSLMVIQPNYNYLYNARQLLPVEDYEKDVRGIEEERAANYDKYIDGSRYMSRKGVPEGPKPPRFPKLKRKYNMTNF